MLEQKQKEKKPPRLVMWGMVAAGTAVILSAIDSLEFHSGSSH
jgi:hypothetical protein